jgi:hypothetical protein
VWVAILGGTRPRTGGCRQAVAFQDLDPLEVFCQGAGHRQPADSRPNDYRALTQETAHDAALLLSSEEIDGSPWLQ